MVPEIVRVTYVKAEGDISVTDVDVTGPLVEAEKSLKWVAALIAKDGGKVLSAVVGTKQAGEFREEQRRRLPLFQHGYRRMAAYLHP